MPVPFESPRTMAAVIPPKWAQPSPVFLIHNGTGDNRTSDIVHRLSAAPNPGVRQNNEAAANRASSAARYPLVAPYSTGPHAVMACSNATNPHAVRSNSANLPTATAQQNSNTTPYRESWMGPTGISPVEHARVPNNPPLVFPAGHPYNIQAVRAPASPYLPPIHSLRATAPASHYYSPPVNMVPSASQSSYSPSICMTDRSEASTMYGDEQPSTAFPSSQPHQVSHSRDRRGAVSSAPISMDNLKNWKPPVHPKTAQEEKEIRDVISTKLSVLFGNLSEENRTKVVAAMLKVHVPKDTVLIQQGDEDGDNFYIVNRGKFNIKVKRPNGTEQQVWESTPGMYFGEVALMYNAPRSATVIAAEDSIVWSLDRVSFRMLLIKEEDTKKKRYEAFLGNIEEFRQLNDYERSRLSDLLTVQEFKAGKRVIKQGEIGDKFYIVEKGELDCKIEQADGSILVMPPYTSGGSFGEVALLSSNETHQNSPSSRRPALPSDGLRQATIHAVTDSVLLWVDKPTFHRVLGPMTEILRQRRLQYQTLTQGK